MKRARLFVSVSLLTGCAGLIGVPDLTFDEQGQGNLDGATADGSSLDGNSLIDGGGPGSCVADLKSDPNHCGRCDHPCSGGACTEGVCQPVLIADGLSLPQGVAVDVTHVYFTTYNDGAVRRRAKDGSGDVELQANVRSAVGVAIDGTTLYFAGEDGVFKCDVAAGCATSKQPVSSTGYSRHVTTADGVLYWTTQLEVRRAFTDGGSEYSLETSVIQPWSLATHGQYVYFTSVSNGLHRVLADGGNREVVGPMQSAQVASFVVSDGEGYAWSYIDETTDAGHVYGSKHDNTSALTTYSVNGDRTTGVAADIRYVYWSEMGSVNAAGADGNGRLLACPRGGCPNTGPIVLASGLRGGGMITLDAEAVYFIENNNFANGGRLRKIAKP